MKSDIMQYHKEQYARIIASISSVSSIIWFLWPNSEWILDWKSLLAVVVTAVSWLVLEYINFHSEEPPSIKALKRIDANRYLSASAIINNHVIYELKQQDLLGSFNDDNWVFLKDFSGQFLLEDLNHFQDAELEKMFEDFKSAFSIFYNGFTSYVHHHNGYYHWIPQGHYYEQDEYDRRYSEVNRLNEQAANLAIKWEEFHNCARLKLAEFLD